MTSPISTRELPLVSVVTATYNCADDLRKTIASLERLDYPLIEWIVIDGGSTDGTVSIAKSSERLSRLVSEPDRGIYDAWNKGVDLAKGEWICFLGAGDQFEPHAISRYVALIQRTVLEGNGPLEYVCSKVSLISNGRAVRTIGRPWTWREFRQYMCTAHCGSLHHRSLFDNGGRFDHSFRIAGDYEFLLRKRSELRAAFLDVVTVEMQTGGASDAKGPNALREAERAKERNGAERGLVARLRYYAAVAKWSVRRRFWY